MPKARSNYECFECKRTILKGEEYQRKTRYERPNDISRQHNAIQKPICSSCIEQNKYSFIDEKYNSPDIVKFGMHGGKLWINVPDDYMTYIYENSKNNKYWDEIEKEYNRRLSNEEFNNINPVSDAKTLEHINNLKKELLNISKSKKTPQLTDVMRKVYVNMLKNNLKIKKLKYEHYNSYYWLYMNTKTDKHIDNRTISALYNRGLLKPTKFKDDIKRRTTEVVEYKVVEDNRISLCK